MLCSLTKQVLAQLGLLRYCQETTACKNDVYLLVKQLDEQEATMHLPDLGYTIVKVEGPFKGGNDEVIAPCDADEVIHSRICRAENGLRAFSVSSLTRHVWDQDRGFYNELQHQLYGPIEGVADQCVRWKHWTIPQCDRLSWLGGVWKA